MGGGVGGHDAGELELLGDGHEVGKIAILGVGRDFQEQGFGVGGRAVEILEGGEEAAEVVGLGEVAQAGGVGGADVDDKKITQRVEDFQGAEVIGGRVGQGGDLGFAEVDADGKVVDSLMGAQPTEPGGKCLGSNVGKTESVHQGLLGRVTKQWKLGVPEVGNRKELPRVKLVTGVKS